MEAQYIVTYIDSNIKIIKIEYDAVGDTWC